MKKSSWKTTVGGLIAAIGAGLSGSSDSTTHLVGAVVSAAGALLLGLAARDNDVTSEQAGVK